MITAKQMAAMLIWKVFYRRSIAASPSAVILAFMDTDIVEICYPTQMKIVRNGEKFSVVKLERLTIACCDFTQTFLKAYF